MDQQNIPINRIAQYIIVEFKITGMRVFGFRLWVAIKLIQLAGFISGMRFEVINNDRIEQ